MPVFGSQERAAFDVTVNPSTRSNFTCNRAKKKKKKKKTEEKNEIKLSAAIVQCNAIKTANGIVRIISFFYFFWFVQGGPALRGSPPASVSCFARLPAGYKHASPDQAKLLVCWPDDDAAADDDDVAGHVQRAAAD